ncbi:uncharacterized protein [Branchiostoma lanceolatum]|uniref:uncharacterized protein n=1 Tax=Branchiostoma lanceolatum TaxID=7740 RepID=UPI00345496A4
MSLPMETPAAADPEPSPAGNTASERLMRLKSRREAFLKLQNRARRLPAMERPREAVCSSTHRRKEEPLSSKGKYRANWILESDSSSDEETTCSSDDEGEDNRAAEEETDRDCATEEAETDRDCATEEAETDRDRATEEAETDRDRATEEAETDRDRATEEAETDRDRATEEAETGRDRATEEAETDRDRATEEAETDRDRATEEAETDRDRATEEAETDRDRATEEAETDRDCANEETDRTQNEATLDEEAASCDSKGKKRGSRRKVKWWRKVKRFFCCYVRPYVMEDELHKSVSVKRRGSLKYFYFEDFDAVYYFDDASHELY